MPWLPVSRRPFCSTTTETLSRTSGRRSATRAPSGRRICTACHSPKIEAITCTTRGSRAAGDRRRSPPSRRGLGARTSICAERVARPRRAGHWSRAAPRRACRNGPAAPRRTVAAARRERGLGQLAGMGVARRLAGHGAQAEAARRVEGGGADAAVVERDALALAVFEEQLAILGAGQRLAQQAFGSVAVESRRRTGGR